MLKMYINEEEVVSNKEFTISEELLATSSTVLNNLYPKSWEIDKDYISKFYYPKDYSLCKIINNNKLIFAGIVKNSGEITLNPRYPKLSSLQILDFKTLLSEGDTLDFVISDKTITEAITQVVNAISEYGFEVGIIEIKNPDDVIGAYSTVDKTAYDVFQYLADISQSKWFTRTIDESTTAIDFYDTTLLPKKPNLQYNSEYWEENNIIDLSFSYGTYDYRNKQTITSEKVFADIDYIEQVLADGYAREFNTQKEIGRLKKITVNGQEKTFATNDDKDIGIEADFYYSLEETTIESNENDVPYSAGSVIVFTYTPLVNGRQIVYNNDEINRINSQLSRNGVISRYETRDDVLDSKELNQIAQTYIRYKGSAEIILKIQTKDVDLYNIGDVVYFEAPIQQLAHDYMVKKKETRIISVGGEDNVFYTYELSSSFNGETEINWFDNQRSKKQGNIETGEYITRNYDIEETANIIFNNLTVSEIEVTGSNILNASLNAPFIE